MIKLFLRIAISLSYLSAVADRLGLWSEKYSVWGNWNNFLDYTKILNPWFPEFMLQPIAILATGAEILFAICLLVGFKTELVAKLSGILLLFFGLAMTFTVGVKSAFDYSVFTASAASFALSLMKNKYLELDKYLNKNSAK